MARRGASSAPPSAQVLTGLANQLTSADPRVEAGALAPGGTPVHGQPVTLLPAGSMAAGPAPGQVSTALITCYASNFQASTVRGATAPLPPGVPL